MATHITLRLAWHNDGWNGHICKNPKDNTYCIGQYSYPGDLIKGKRNLAWEENKDVKGKPCSKLDNHPACALSINAFGKEHLKALNEPPVWFNDGSKGVYIDIPPSTVCIWPYEEMYTNDVTNHPGESQKYDYNERLKKAKDYFNELENDKSLIFYYANYSNPFSEEDQRKYVVVGLSRLKKVGKLHFYENVSDRNKEKYAGGFVWQMPITSHYPDEGLRIPYEKYKDNPEVLKKILLVPDNVRNFKYATRPVSNDNALSLIERFLEIVNTLIDLNDDTENWTVRKEWLINLFNELWKSRGAYPGLPIALSILNFEEGIDYYKEQTEKGNDKEAYQNLCGFITGKKDTIEGISLSSKDTKQLQRNWKLKSEEEQNFLLNTLPRYDLSKAQAENILSEERSKNNLYFPLKDINANPYLICENYLGDDIDDFVSFNKIDHGILPSPDLGIVNLFENNSSERFRALCIEQLKRMDTHSFISAESILERVNLKLSTQPDWKKDVFSMKYFEVDEEFIEQIVKIRKHDEKIYLYLRNVYEDERIIQNVIESLVQRPNIKFKVPVTHNYFFNLLKERDSELINKAEKEYFEALHGQSNVCEIIFNKPLSIISGPAGTGKTTIVRAIINAIEKTNGESASIYLMAPTGKASERLKVKTRKSATTIHSFLASQGWLNDNFSLKRKDGKVEDKITTLIIDECSMIDLELFAALYKSVNWNSVQRLILVGDPNQLPPIGKGKVFSDIIEWLKKNHSENVGFLNINVRQLENKVFKQGDGILRLADIFIQEKQIEKNYDKTKKEEIIKKLQEGGDIDKDLRVLYWNDVESLEKLIKDRIIRDLENDTREKLEDDKVYLLWQAAIRKDEKYRARYQQVISPVRSEYYGVDNLNQIFQKLYNGYQANKTALDGISLFDKVIQIRNRPKSNSIYAYNKSERKQENIEIYNGEIGFVKPHGFDNTDWKKYYFILKRFQVVFDRKENHWVGFGKGLGKNDKGRWLPAENPEENLELGYVISVHKAQGSEFERVYFILPKKQKGILSMELFYTAITRARKHLTIFAEEDVSTFLTYTRIENSILKRINSSIFEFNPIPEDMLSLHTWYEEGKVISTLSEYFVRSKSEMNIANILSLRNISFSYEKPLFAIDGTMYLPDFTITWQGEEYYWEHVGRLDLPVYKKHWEEKEKWYEKNFPGKLIVTYESNNQSKEIEEIIKNKFYID